MKQVVTQEYSEKFMKNKTKDVYVGVKTFFKSMHGVFTMHNFHQLFKDFACPHLLVHHIF